MSRFLDITVGARGSRLSQKQVWEVEKELRRYVPRVRFFPIWVQTKGDRDQETSLRTLEKTDFFTHEIDVMQKKGIFRVSIHSAKDLSEPLAEGLSVIAITEGLSNCDVLVLREGESLEVLAQGGVIGTSSERRIAAVQALRSDFKCVDIRGNIEKRLSALDEGEIDGLVVALCALERLEQAHRNYSPLPGPVAPLQGKLAVIALSEDEEMHHMFKCIHDEKAHALSRE